MATWDELLQELQQTLTENGQHPDFDRFRRSKMHAVSDITGRPLLVYATDFLDSEKVRACRGEVMIDIRDKVGFRELVRSVNADAVDILLFSPGGIAEATESIVEILRSAYGHVRFIVPMIAKSAATMLALSGDEILMDEVSELGPTDPQLEMVRDGQTIRAPAGAVLAQFEAAKASLSKDASLTPVWLPILRQYGPSLLAECQTAIDLSRTLVGKWLREYMFAADDDAEAKAEHIATYLATHENYMSHGRRVGLNELTALGVQVFDLRAHPQLHEAVWDLQYAIDITFQSTSAFKIFESTGGAALIRLIRPLVSRGPSGHGDDVERARE